MQALEQIGLALSNDKIVENRFGIAQDLFAFGRIYQRQQEWEKAHNYYLRAFLVYETLGIRFKMLDTLPYLEEAARALGDDESLLRYEEARTTLEEQN